MNEYNKLIIIKLNPVLESGIPVSLMNVILIKLIKCQHMVIAGSARIMMASIMYNLNT